LAYRLLAGQRERAHGAAVEAAVRGDDDRAGGALVAADQLERRLVGLGARVGEEHPAVGGQQREEAFGEGYLALVEEQIGGVGDGAYLAGHRLRGRRGGVAQRADRDAGDGGGVLPATGTPAPPAPAAHQRQRRHAVGAHDRRLEPRLKLLGGTHLSASLAGASLASGGSSAPGHR